MNNYYTLQELARINIETQLKAGQAAQLYKRSKIGKRKPLEQVHLSIDNLFVSIRHGYKKVSEATINLVQNTDSACPECAACC